MRASIARFWPLLPVAAGIVATVVAARSGDNALLAVATSATVAAVLLALGVVFVRLLRRAGDPAREDA